MAIRRLSLLISVVIAALCVESKYMVYNTSQGIVQGKLNVHLVPHSHDDVGWLKTIDQYYVGSNNSIQVACVQNVLDSLIPALLADKNRKFIYVEQAFFQRWWQDQSELMQNTVKQLVNLGQLEFINGGMCMHDEAAPHYIDMVDQTTLGHRFIKEEFNVTPRIGWQIDPFGHSAVQAYLLGAEVGFDSLFFGRIDYQDIAKRKLEKSLEVVWQGSKSFGSSAQIFAGAFPRNYEPPTGFYFEVGDDSPIVQDNINLFDYNVQERVNDFVSAALAQANITRTNHIMWTMGTDFKYQYAHTWYRNMDKLIHYVNQDGRVNALYSTPTIYTDAKYAEHQSWPLKTDDYFPYADRKNAYWTGYFTSRPGLKGYVRVMSGYYLAARQLEFFRGRSEKGPTTDTLGDALAVAQHHDAVSGTSKQHVADDYAKRLFIGYKEAEELVAASLAFMVDSGLKSRSRSSVTKFQQCPLLNITYCPATEVDLSQGKKLVVVVYNSLGWKRDGVVKIPVIHGNVSVQDSSGQEIESQLLPLGNVSLGVRNFYATAYVGKSPSVTPRYWLAFTASVPPLGFSTYVISTPKGAAATFATQTLYESKGSENGIIEVGPGNLKLIYSASEGKLTQYVNTKSSVKASIEQSYSYYSGDDGSQEYYDGSQKYFQASGAYVFRPNGTFPIASEGQIPFTVLRGPLFDEVHQKINSWIHQVTRVYKEKEHVEVEFTVGPIPVDDGIGKEIVTQFTTAIKSNKTFYTDSSGRDFLQRIRDYRADWDLQVNQPVAGNYYPINLGMYIKDESEEFSVLVDRSVGGSSIVDGQLELMLHRRLLHDDGRGVDEALNETVCVHNKCSGLTAQGKFYLRIDPLGEGAKWRRSFGQEIYSPFLLAVTEQDTNINVPIFKGMEPSYSLPDNVAMITLQELEDGKVLLRLAHLYEVGEDKDLSVLASVELKKLFPDKKIRKVTEMSLSANQEREEMIKKRLVWKVEGSQNDKSKVLRGGPVDPIKLVVEIAPMEIRTFVIEFPSLMSPVSRGLVL
ncbi:probable alpha-mannosidase At5g13980 [Rhododendron vialii]|uniref:probable alpha-mannosidase At5g13980 n=1 Tax=Rhododendron vialii TaxID=182163 RepID=UPI00265F477C|nr:probable alpha-mannosidase At5g13980 [Rhododendron vialii]